MSMRIMKIIGIFMLSLSLGMVFHSSPSAKSGNSPPEEEAGPYNAPVFVSIFWIGLSEKSCSVRESLVMDTLADCESDYTRAENEVKEKVAKKKSMGGAWKWGVFTKCKEFPNSKAFDKEMEKLKTHCSGS